MKAKFLKRAILIALSLTVLPLSLFAEGQTEAVTNQPVGRVTESDWPMWRYDTGRSAASPAELPAELTLQWEHQYTPRVPTWNDPLNQDLMHYDKVFEPIVVGGTMFLNFNDTDKVVAINTETGQEMWEFYTDGPIRMPGVVHNKKLYITSDDGFVYCLDASDGSLVWKFQAAPADRKILGNERLISTWPVRGGLVIEDGIAYFGASIFPLMGTFLYGVDAETGEQVWINDREGSRFMKQPHGGSQSFAGVAPQGSFTIAGDTLLAAGGRSVPAAFDKATGEYRYYEYQSSGKTGGSFIAATENIFLNHHREQMVSMYSVNDGSRLVSALGRYPVIDGDMLYTSGDSVRAYDISWTKGDLSDSGEKFKNGYRWEIVADASGDLIKAGNRLYAGGENSITAIDVSGTNPKIDWIIPVVGKVERLIAANSKLFAVTLGGNILCFSDLGMAPRRILETPVPPAAKTAATRTALSILEKTGTQFAEGYMLYYGIDDADVLEAIVNSSNLRVIAVDENESRVQALRKRFDQAGLYGRRLQILQGNPITLGAPDYMAVATVVTEDWPLSQELLNALYKPMRPYGGTVWFKNAPSNLSSTVRSAGLSKLEISGKDMLLRAGALEGSAPFTHNMGDVANTGVSKDELVKAPLGVLWFGGGTDNTDVLPRHGHGPIEQVINGRLYIEGMDRITCRDVYTGVEIWQRRFDDMDMYDIYYDLTYKDTPTSTRYNQEHNPGANIRGTNYIATEDLIYVINHTGGRGGRHRVQAVNAATGEWELDIHLPDTTYTRVDGRVVEDRPSPWSYIGVYEDLLIGGGMYVAFSDLAQITPSEVSLWENYDYSASKTLNVLDRHTGELKWTVESELGFLNNAICAGDGKLFVMDKPHPQVEDQMARKGLSAPTEKYTLTAYDIETGRVLWEDANASKYNDTVFGSYLTYSEEYDILLQSTRPSRDTVAGESGKRFIAYRGSTGEILWDKEDQDGLYVDLPLLWNDTIVSPARFWRDHEKAIHFDLLTGEVLTRTNPITGNEADLTWRRGYGCSHALGAQHLMTFRSGAAGYFDMTQLGGVGNFGGFKTGCTNALVVADGLLNSPDYTRTCNCAYSNQASLALIHMPELETWTFNELAVDDDIKTIGINLGAPGDRADDAGCFWFEYPYVGYSTYRDGEWGNVEVPVNVNPGSPDYYLHHSIRFTGEMPWVVASGCEGVRSLTIDKTSGSYTVRLFFAEPNDSVKRGDRVFDVQLQGRTVLSDFDVVAEAGGPRIGVVKEFTNVRASGGKIELNFGGSDAIISGIELISN